MSRSSAQARVICPFVETVPGTLTNNNDPKWIFLMEFGHFLENQFWYTSGRVLFVGAPRNEWL